ncbi:MAG TPA: hypothetical protein VMY59_08810 [Candidatus Thermoplasmatota archaeon]|nr:hypothetical protein [Candidatus Thermoplasmatota archaeon]
MYTIDGYIRFFICIGVTVVGIVVSGMIHNWWMNKKHEQKG